MKDKAFRKKLNKELLRNVQRDNKQDYNSICKDMGRNRYKKTVTGKAGLEEDEYCFEIEGRNISNLNGVDTILIAENAKHLQTLVRKVKEHGEKWKSNQI